MVPPGWYVDRPAPRAGLVTGDLVVTDRTSRRVNGVDCRCRRSPRTTCGRLLSGEPLGDAAVAPAGLHGRPAATIGERGTGASHPRPARWRSDTPGEDPSHRQATAGVSRRAGRRRRCSLGVAECLGSPQAFMPCCAYRRGGPRRPVRPAGRWCARSRSRSARLPRQGGGDHSLRAPVTLLAPGGRSGSPSEHPVGCPRGHEPRPPLRSLRSHTSRVMLPPWGHQPPTVTQRASTSARTAERP